MNSAATAAFFVALLARRQFLIYSSWSGHPDLAIAGCFRIS